MPVPFGAVTSSGAVDEAFLAEVVRSSSDPYLVLDDALLVSFVSDPIVGLVGRTAAECLGRPVLDFVAPDDRGAVTAAVTEFVDPDRDDEGWAGPPLVIDLVHADGSLVPCEVLGVDRGRPASLGLVVRLRLAWSTVLLDRAITAMVTADDLDHVLGQLLDLLARQMPGSAGTVSLDWDGTAFARTVGPATRRLPPDLVPPGVDRTHADLASLPPSLAEAARAAGFAGCWINPLDLGGTVDAVLAVWRPVPGPAPRHQAAGVARVASLVRLAVVEDRNRRELEVQARTDGLTGVANRFGLVEHLEELGRTRPGTPIGLLYGDLDDFKPVNDRHGHGTGDAVLVAVARRLVDHVAPDDVVARLGGDEFAVVCVGVGEEELAERVDRVSRSFDEPVVAGEVSVALGLSIGTALVADAWHGRPVQDLLRDADAALLRAKARQGPPAAGRGLTLRARRRHRPSNRDVDQPSSRAAQARSHRRHASAQIRQCSWWSAWASQSSAHRAHAVRQAVSTACVSSAS